MFHCPLRDLGAKLNLLRWGHESGPQLFGAGLTGLDLLGLDIPDPTLGPARLAGLLVLGLLNLPL